MTKLNRLTDRVKDRPTDRQTREQTQTNIKLYRLGAMSKYVGVANETKVPTSGLQVTKGHLLP